VYEVIVQELREGGESLNEEFVDGVDGGAEDADTMSFD
jgi:hypothetical protein